MIAEVNNSKESTVPKLSGIGLGKSFFGNQVLKNVNIELYPGEIHAFVGENGAGKSTAAKILSGVYQPTTGYLEYDGKKIKLDSPITGLANGIALIHQEPHVFPDLTVAENIFMGHQPLKKFRRIDWQELNTKAQGLLNELGSKVSPTMKVHKLSIADQQMIEVSAALSHNSQVIIFDETTAALTGKEAKKLFGTMRGLAKKGATIAFIGHRMEEIFEYCDRLTVLRDGEKVAEKMRHETSIEEVLKLMVGRDVENSYNRGNQTIRNDIVLDVQSLTNTYLKNISFKIRAGEIVGLGGLVGAGRTRIARALYGVDLIESGTISINEKPVKIKSPADAIAKGLALVAEDRNRHSSFAGLNLIENTTLSSLSDNSSLGFISRKKERQNLAKWIERMTVRHRHAKQPISELSGGNAQKLILSRALLTNPKLLILDEPTRGIDIGAKHEVHKEITKLAEQGMAVLMISSELPELLALSDTIHVIRDGRLGRSFNHADATAEAIIAAATGQEISGELNA